MHLIRLEAANYRLHSRLVVDFDDLGSFTVTGPNGVGKSSFIEAVLYAFYGYHRSAETQGAAANRIVKIGQQACAVTLDFTVNGAVYRIVRKRRSVGRGSSELELYRFNGDGSQTAVTEGGAAATQAAINRLVPAVSTLLATNFVKQKDAARFPSERPAGRKAVLRSIFQIEEFRTMAREARAKVGAAEERAAAHERGADGLEADEAALETVRAEEATAVQACNAARAALGTARAELQAASDARARAEERAAQAERLQREREAKAEHVAALEREAAALDLTVQKLVAAADPQVAAAGAQAAADLPIVLRDLAEARAALVRASERCAEARSLDESAARVEQRLRALAERMAAPLPDLQGRTEAEIAAAAGTLAQARAALVEASRAADAHRAAARDLDRLMDRARAAELQVRELPAARDDLAELEARAAGVDGARREVAELAGRVAELAGLRQQIARSRQSLQADEARLSTLPPPAADLPELERLAGTLDDRRAARAAAASTLDAARDQERDAQAKLGAARESFASLQASLAAAEAAAAEGGGAACSGSGWLSPEGLSVDLFAVCPLSAAAAKNRAALPALRARVEDATAAGKALRQTFLDAGIAVTEAREALAAAEQAAGDAEAAQRRLEAVRRADAQRIELQREIDAHRGRISELEQGIAALGQVEAQHAAAAERQRGAEQALDELGRARAAIETRRTKEADSAALAAEVVAARAGVESTVSTVAAESEARAAAEDAERAADLLARLRSAIESRQTTQREHAEVQRELDEARARRTALGDPTSERVAAERRVPELEAAEVVRRREIEAGQNAERASRDLAAARLQADAAASRARVAAAALAAMPMGDDGGEAVEAARTAEQTLREQVAAHEASVAAADRTRHAAEAQAAVLASRCEMKRQAQAAAHAELAEAAAWSRTAETCELAPTLIIEQSIAELEAEANAVLEKISSRGLRLRLETQRALSSGDEMAETLDILIDYDVGTLTYEDLSGGEQTRIDMALRVGLSRLLAGGQHVDFLILDEGWGDLDPEGVDTLREVVAGLQRLYANVILVTHKEVLFGMFGRRLHFEHAEGGSTMRVL